MLRCPESHGEAFLVMSTGELLGRMVRSGILGCPICRRELPLAQGGVDFSGGQMGGSGGGGAPGGSPPASRVPHPLDAEAPQALWAPRAALRLHLRFSRAA